MLMHFTFQTQESMKAILHR